MPFFRCARWKWFEGKSDGSEDTKDEGRKEEESGSGDVWGNTRMDRGGNSGGVCGHGRNEVGAGGEGEDRPVQRSSAAEATLPLKKFDIAAGPLG